MDISTHLAEGHAALAAVTSHSLLHVLILLASITLGTWR